MSPPAESERFNPELDVGIKAMAKHIGIGVAQSFVSSVADIQHFPAISILKNGNVVLLRSYDNEAGVVNLYDPLSENNAVLTLPESKLIHNWTGKIYHLRQDELSKPEASYGGGEKKESWVITRLREARFHYRSIVFTGFIVNIFSLISPFFLMIVLDKVVPHSAWTTLTVLGIAVSIVVLFESIFDYLKNLLTLLAAKASDLSMQTKLYEHFISLQYTFLKHGQKGIWARTLTEPERIRGFITNRALSSGIDLVFVFIFGIAMAWMSLSLFVIAALGGLFQLAIGLVINPLIKHKINHAMGADNRREAFLTESIASIDVIKALGAERSNCRYWKSVVTASIENRHNLQLLVAAIKGVTGFIDKIIYIIIIWFGSALVISGETTVGILVASSILARRITTPIMQLASLINDYHEVLASARAIDNLANQPREQDNQAGTKLALKITGQYDFSNVHYQYPGNHVFDVHLDVSLPSNSMIAIAGASGSGKSTIARLLLGLITPSEGVVRVDGQDIRNLDFENYRNQIGTVLQDTQLFSGTVKENISYGMPGASLEAIVKAASMAGADEFIQRLPEGYGTPLDENASNLSGGQRQRIALARAILRNPRVLLLDEATSSLDPESEAIIIKNLQEIRRNRTVISVSHRLSSIANSDIIIFMDNGKIAASGSHKELLNTCSQYRALWLTQNSHGDI